MAYRFAEAYDKIMEQTAGLFSKIIIKNMEKYSPSATTVLDIGCGTGNIMLRLAKKYEVSGIDLSRHMVKIAKRKGLNVKVMDLRKMQFSRKFDAVICTNDTINHMTNPLDLKNVFGRVYECLNSGGIFIFDCNTTAKLKDNKTDFYQSDKCIFAVKNYSKSGKMFWDIFMYRKSIPMHEIADKLRLSDNLQFKKTCKTYELKKETITERIYKLSELKRMLRKFNTLKVINFEGKAANENKDKRAFFICAKIS